MGFKREGNDHFPKLCLRNVKSKLHTIFTSESFDKKEKNYLYKVESSTEMLLNVTETFRNYSYLVWDSEANSVISMTIWL